MQEHHDDFDRRVEALEIYFRPSCSFSPPTLMRPSTGRTSPSFWTRSYARSCVKQGCGLRQGVNKLVKVMRLDGSESWVLVSVEIQSQYDADLADRMFSYHYRIYDRFHRKVSSIVILGDDTPGWRPNRFGYEIWDTEISLRFPVVKLDLFSLPGHAGRNSRPTPTPLPLSSWRI